MGKPSRYRRLSPQQKCAALIEAIRHERTADLTDLLNEPDIAQFINLAEGCSKKGDAPLHEAALYGRTDYMEALIRAGANADQPGAGGKTALHTSAWLGFAPAGIKILLQAGADPTRRDYEGKSARDHAQSRSKGIIDKEIADYLAAAEISWHARQDQAVLSERSSLREWVERTGPDGRDGWRQDKIDHAYRDKISR